MTIASQEELLLTLLEAAPKLPLERTEHDDGSITLECPIEDVLTTPRRFGVADRSEAKPTTAVARERTKLEALQARAKERLARDDDDKKALQNTLRMAIVWISSNISVTDLPERFSEASHMASYGTPPRRGLRPLMRRSNKR